MKKKDGVRLRRTPFSIVLSVIYDCFFSITVTGFEQMLSIARAWAFLEEAVMTGWPFLFNENVNSPLFLVLSPIVSSFSPGRPPGLLPITCF
jgi:hypothetical protein